MSHIEINTEEIPDKVPVIPAGEYVLECFEAATEIGKTRDDGSPGDNQLLLKLKVVAPGTPNDGRQHYERLNLSPQDFFRVKLKKALQSLGVPLSKTGFNAQDCIGKSARVLMSVRTYKDKQTDETIEASNIKQWLVPA